MKPTRTNFLSSLFSLFVYEKKDQLHQPVQQRPFIYYVSKRILRFCDHSSAILHGFSTENGQKLQLSDRLPPLQVLTYVIYEQSLNIRNFTTIPSYGVYIMCSRVVTSVVGVVIHLSSGYQFWLKSVESRKFMNHQVGYFCGAIRTRGSDKLFIIILDT